MIDRETKDWREKKLEDIAFIKMGQSPKSIYYNTKKQGLPFFQGRAEFGYIYPKEQKWCTKELKIAEKGDILLTVRAPVGDVNIANNKCIIGRGLCAIRAKHKNDNYLFYLLKAHKKYISSKGTGSVYDAINKNQIQKLNFLVPNRKTQNKIASILSAYDDLIENNNRRIKILEEMAQAIYKEWFVNFKFPGHEKVTMVDSEMGKIPEGWKVFKVGDIIECIESGSRPKGGIDPKEREVPSIGAENILGLGQYDFSKEKYVSRSFFNNMQRGVIKDGDVLLYKDGAKIGRKSMFRDGFPHKFCCINEHVFILRTKSRSAQNYLYFYLDRPDITQTIIGLNTNAAQPGINQRGVKGLPFLFPGEKLIEMFEAKVEPLVRLLFNLAKKNKLLRRKRDLLLPKLISGELDVSDLDINTEDLG